MVFVKCVFVVVDVVVVLLGVEGLLMMGVVAVSSRVLTMQVGFVCLCGILKGCILGGANYHILYRGQRCFVLVSVCKWGRSRGQGWVLCRLLVEVA